MRRDSQRLFLRIQFIGSTWVLYIQNSGIFFLKSNSNGGQRASCALGVHGISRVLLFDIQQSVHVFEDLIKRMNKTDSSDNKIQIDHFDIQQYVVQDNHSINNEYDHQKLQAIIRIILKMEVIKS